MVAIIKGDIIESRKLIDQGVWQYPLKLKLSEWGNNPDEWEVVWGDSFQIEVKNPVEALQKAIEIKALIKKIKPVEKQKNSSTIDVRMAIGIGDKTYSGSKISESNGPAFVYSGEKFDILKKDNITLGFKSPWQSFDDEINLYLKLACLFMDKWSVNSAELVEIVLEHPGITQEEIGSKLNIKQNSVSGRWKRANIDEILDVEKVYRRKISDLLL